MKSQRLVFFDCARGMLIIAMIVFHACYDLVYIEGIALPWFSGLTTVVWSRFVACGFLFIAGCMSTLSRNNFKRALKYLLVALLIFLVTFCTGIVTPISFGIIWCMGVCTLTEWLLTRLGIRVRGYVCAIACILVYLLLMNMATGVVGWDAYTIELPRFFYTSGHLSWLGFPGPSFASGDYYPLLPNLFVFLAGTSFARALNVTGWPVWCMKSLCQPLECMGRHALLVYVLHQPVLMLFCTAVLKVLGV